jgi:enamine deaminase RidA (YjgF/YER057c/UK114 family)
MTHVQLIRSPELAAAPYAYAATAPAGTRYVFLAGACPLDATGAVVSPGDIEGQTEQVLANLRVALAAAGCSIPDVVQTRVLVATADREDLGRVWRIVAEAFGAHDAPSTLTGVTVLGYAGQLVEVEAIAAVPAG